MKNFFKGISVSQIIAGALAAVTSFLLSAKIGIAGSVIGVAVGSIVSAVASQIYQNVLKESGRKLQESVPQDDGTAEQNALSADPGDQTRVIGSDAQHHGRLSGPVSAQAAQSVPIPRMDGTSPSLAALVRNKKMATGSDQKDATRTLAAERQESRNKTGDLGDADGKYHADDGKNDSTEVLTSSASGKTTVMAPIGKTRATKAISGTRQTLNGGPGQHDGHVRVFDSSRQKRYKRLAIVVAVVSALVAVGITAGIISLATKGQGTDDVVRNIVTNSTTKNQPQRNDSDNTPSDSNQKTDGNTQKNNGTNNQGNSGTTSDSGTSNGPTSNGSGTANGSGNTNGGNSGNGNSGNTGGGTGSNSNGSSNSSNDSSNSGAGNGGGADSGSTNGSPSNSNGTGSSDPGSHTGDGTPGANTSNPQ